VASSKIPSSKDGEKIVMDKVKTQGSSAKANGCLKPSVCGKCVKHGNNCTKTPACSKNTDKHLAAIARLGLSTNSRERGAVRYVKFNFFLLMKHQSLLLGHPSAGAKFLLHF
jgi:hypothetical protein